MTPVVAIVGYSNSGKTTVASYLIQALTELGYRVAAIKHCHAGHQPDKLDSDTSRLFQSGAASVTASSPGKRTRTDRVDGDASLERLASDLEGDFDLILAEGFKSSGVPKILVSNGSSPPPEVDNILALVGNYDERLVVPTFSIVDMDGLVELVRTKMTKPSILRPSVRLTVDGEDVPLSRYPSMVLRNLVEGFVKSLKGVSVAPREVNIKIEEEKGA